jgi:DHA3 family tetracycline resistance protein-like MFS transporter
MVPSAYSVWIVFNGVGAFVGALSWTVAPIYFVTVVGMNPLELVLVGTVMEVSYFLSEVPTGALADAYSRKLSIVIGTLITSAAVLVVGLVPEVLVILCAWAGWGLGAAFEEGALQAWLADEIGQEGLSKAFFAGGRAEFAGGLVGICTSVALASIDLRLPIIVAGGIGLALGLWLLFRMPETGYVRGSGEARSWRAVGRTAAVAVRLVRGRPVLLTLLAISAFTGMWSEGIDRLWQAHVLELGIPQLGNFEPIIWFGIIGVAGKVLSYGAYEVAERRLGLTEPLAAARALLVLAAILAASTLGFALAGTFAVAVVAFLILGVARSLQGPIWMTWLNKNVEDSSVRATVISIMGQGDAVGQFAGGPAIGAVSTLSSLRAGLTFAGVALAPAMGLYAHAIRRGGRETVLDEAATAAVESRHGEA